MKALKKICSLLLVAALLVCLGSAVFADTPHTYKAYQIFRGTQNEETGELAQIEWGWHITETNFLSGLKASAAFGDPNPFKDCTTASDVAAVLSDLNSEALTIQFAKLAFQYVRLDAEYKCCPTDPTQERAPGYYLLVDMTDPATGDYKDIAMVKVTSEGKITYSPKTSVPTVDKFVKETDDSTGYVSQWQKDGDYDIGDSVPFMLEATLGSMYGYDRYYICFHDTLSAGLTYDTEKLPGMEKSYKVELVSKTEGTTDVTGAFTRISRNGEMLFYCSDVLALGAQEGDKINVYFNAILNSKANIGSKGNPNDVYLEFSNNPNVIVDPKTPPYSPDNPPADTGETPVVRVIVFTYEIVVNKAELIHDEPVALKGADFDLYKYDLSVEGYWKKLTKAAPTTEDTTTFSWVGVDAGKYKLVESATPAGYNPIEPIEFSVVSTVEDKQLKALEVQDAEGKTISGEKGSFSVTIGENAAICETTIINQRGLILPETGGKGEKAFFAIGGLMVLGGVVLLAARKRVGEP